MPTHVNRRNTVYGYPNPQAGLQQEPLVFQRDPTTADAAELGVIWVNPLTNTYWIATSTGSAGTVWTSISNGPATFTSLTVTPGPTSITGQFTLTAGTNTASFAADASDHSTNVGSATGTSATTIKGGTGGVTIDGAATTPITIGNAAQTAAINIGNSAATHTVTISGTAVVSAATDTVNIATGGVNTSASADKVVNIASGTTLLGTQAVNILTGTAASGANQLLIGGSDFLTTSTIRGPLSVQGADILIAATSTASVGALQFTAGGPRIMAGAGAPSAGLALVVGDMYINTTAASATTRLYIATAASTWTNVTCAA